MMIPAMTPENSDAFALQAAAASSQYYSQALLDRLTNVGASASFLPPATREMLGLSNSLNLRPPNDLLGFAHGAFLASSAAGSEANLSSSASLFASGLSSAGNTNLINAGVGASALTRHYLQLLQDRQDAANYAQYTGGRPQGDNGSQYPNRDNEEHGYQDDARKY
jgi:hypothetical protein